jgi:hypothetical protein
MAEHDPEYKCLHCNKKLKNKRTAREHHKVCPQVVQVDPSPDCSKLTGAACDKCFEEIHVEVSFERMEQPDFEEEVGGGASAQVC